jgi:prophage regulatory protein
MSAHQAVTTPTEPGKPPCNRLVALPEVKARTGMGTTWIYKHAKDGTFPKPLKLSERCTRWKESEIDAWIDSRPRL